MEHDDDFASAVEALHQASLRVRELGGDTIDAVFHAASGTAYLLPDVQVELHKMERANRRRAAERAAVLDALPAHLAILDETGTIVAVNKDWRDFAFSQGYPDDTAGVGLNYLKICRDVVGKDTAVAQAVAEGLDRVLAGQSDEVSVDYPCQTPEALLWFTVMIAPVRGVDRPGAVVLHIDITKRLQIEGELRAAQKLEAIGQLTGGIAHDFNNLLTVILGSGDMLVDALKHEPTLARLAESTVLMAERGAELTARLLAFARCQPLSPQRTNVNERLIALEDLLRRTLGGDIEVRLALSDDIWITMIDTGEFDNAILNLSINSRDAMPDGGHLRIETTNIFLNDLDLEVGQDSSSGEYVVVTVSDDGIGMPQSTLTRAVDPFFTTKGVGKGSGLGLSMVYGFIRQTGGHIQIESEPNVGTIVRLYFPKYAGGQVELEPSSGNPGMLPGRETVLVVEDDGAIARQLAEQLTRLGYTVISASEGGAALTILKDRPDIDLLLSDIVLPGGMNGRQTVAAARVMRPELKVLYTSGGAGDDVDYLEPGDELLNKPYRWGDLAATVRRVLDA